MARDLFAEQPAGRDLFATDGLPEEQQSGFMQQLTEGVQGPAEQLGISGLIAQGQMPIREIEAIVLCSVELLISPCEQAIVHCSESASASIN